MKYILYFLSLSVFVLVGALTGAPPANAVSPYDSYIQNAPTPYTIKSSNNALTSSFDNVEQLLDYYQTNFETRLGQGQPFCGNTFDAEYFQTKIINNINANRPYLISQMTSNSIHFIVQTSTTATTTHTWYDDGMGTVYDNYYSSEPSFAFFYITIANNGNRPICGYYKDLQNASSMGSGQIIGSTMPFTTPPEYTGQIPNPISTPPTTIDTAPNWYVSNIIANVGTFHDKNFNTFDANPFLCEGGLAPILNYEIFRIKDGQPDILLTSGYQSATAQITYNFGEADTDRKILLVGWYDCGDGTIFPNQGRYEFTINRAGLLKIDLFEACVFETWPFVDANACLDNLYTVINLFYFGKVALPNFSFDSSCRNLTTMDDWLGLPNGYQVCPQVPEFVRTVTTPFVAFMLGLITLGFIKRIRTEFDG